MTACGSRMAACAARGFYDRLGKRALDVIVAGAALVVLSPLLALIAAAVLLTLGRPVLYSEVRAGRHGTPFVLRKFRTMTGERDAAGQLLPDAERITPLGRLLRASSLDELPELLHVLQGVMSLVGPRPLPVRYVSRYAPQQARRLDVTPGITGLAQVRGRNTLSWEEKFALDVAYVERRGFWLDVRILLLTLVVVLRRDGVSHPGHTTMHEFSGQMQ